MKRLITLMIAVGVLASQHANSQNAGTLPEQVSGIYPSLAYYNGEDEGECGTGAVVPWAGKLWVVTYGPHMPNGSGDKLYMIDSDLTEIVFPLSIGGTPANRMIHRESNQLVIGPYVIDAAGGVRVIPWQTMPGRLTGNARDLTDPAGHILYATMEEGFYRVDLNSLEVEEIYPDANANGREGKNDHIISPLLPGVHGKGFYSGQGVAVFSNNGEPSDEALRNPDIESGVLAEWDGKGWKVVRRCQFTEVTGPGGICGNGNPATDPIWAVGWDSKSVILALRDASAGWSFYRLPKASHSYDGAHGWNTEWPRIRNVGTEADPDYLMTMHGMFWSFPGTFSKGNTAGIRPRSSYLKVIGDFTSWNGRLVFGCDDSATNEFLNGRKAKGGIKGPGQSNSNLWFTSLRTPDQLGPTDAEGTLWKHDKVGKGEASDPFLFAGWKSRCAWLSNDGGNSVKVTFEIDRDGSGRWEKLLTKSIAPGKTAFIPFPENTEGEWIRARADRDARLYLSFSYKGDRRNPARSDAMFSPLATLDEGTPVQGLLRSLGENRRSLGFAGENGYYEMGDQLRLVRKDGTSMEQDIRDNMKVNPEVIKIEESSVLVVDDSGRRWRLPLGDPRYKDLTEAGQLRICREVVTERDLFSCMGTFYELPGENADGFAKIRPVCTHNYLIGDYASYRGMMLLTGVRNDAPAGGHVAKSGDGRALLWAGAIDDLWKMPAPSGQGGPWKEQTIKKGETSDPYLMAGYLHKTLNLTNHGRGGVTLRMQVDPVGDGSWLDYASFSVPAGKTLVKALPDDLSARWIRFVAAGNGKVSTILEYR